MSAAVQTDRVERVLRQRGPAGVTTLDFKAPVVDGGPPIERLAARILELKKRGLNITKTMVPASPTGGARIARYVLTEAGSLPAEDDQDHGGPGPAAGSPSIPPAPDGDAGGAPSSSAAVGQAAAHDPGAPPPPVMGQVRGGLPDDSPLQLFATDAAAPSPRSAYDPIDEAA